MKRTATTKRTRRKDPRIGGPGPCDICHTFSGGRTLTFSKFFRGGAVPSWAMVHKGCDRRESFQQFLERFARWQARQDTEGRAVPASTVAVDASAVADAVNRPSAA